MAAPVLYGFAHLADRFNDRVTEVGVEVVNDAITQTLEEHQRQMAAVTPLFVTRTTRFKQVYRPSSITRNQPLDEWGRPQPIKAAGRYEVAWPMHRSGNAIGWNWETGIKQTVAEVNRDINTIITGDYLWVFDHILAALYHGAEWPFYDDENGELTILPLANGDDTEYSVMPGAVSGATDDHYLAQLEPIADATNPFPAIEEDLSEHPENGPGEVVSFIPKNLKASVEALDTFHRIGDPNVRVGANNDELVGTLGVDVPGTLIGYEDAGVWVVQWDRLPSDYIVSVHSGGDTPLAMREDEVADLQGFIEVPRREDQPYYERAWYRKAGFGALNRVGGHITRIGNGTYAPPTGYTNPMP